MSWAFDAKAAAPVAYDVKAATKLLNDAGWKKKDGAWTAKDGKAPYELELLTVPAAANPRLASVAAAIAKAWTDFGIKVDVVETPAVDLAKKLRGGEFAAAAAGHHDGPRAGPVSAARLEPGPRLGDQPVRLPGPRPGRAAGDRPQARHARGADDGVEELLTGLAARQPLLPIAWHSESVLFRGVDGPTARLIAGPGDRFWDVLAWRLAADR